VVLQQALAGIWTGDVVKGDERDAINCALVARDASGNRWAIDQMKIFILPWPSPREYPQVTQSDTVMISEGLVVHHPFNCVSL